MPSGGGGHVSGTRSVPAGESISGIEMDSLGVERQNRGGSSNVGQAALLSPDPSRSDRRRERGVSASFGASCELEPGVGPLRPHHSKPVVSIGVSIDLDTKRGHFEREGVTRRPLVIRPDPLWGEVEASKKVGPPNRERGYLRRPLVITKQISAGFSKTLRAREENLCENWIDTSEKAQNPVRIHQLAERPAMWIQRVFGCRIVDRCAGSVATGSWVMDRSYWEQIPRG